ncbi:hypothetical protein OEZ86_014407 [Tetradesmus obliquus]|nr:hypothetical protein OEZ86_014407 [Tetradesmus obliquus]
MDVSALGKSHRRCLCWYGSRLIDPADPGLNGAADGPLYCEQCQAYVQRGSKHCRECDKCVLGFDHHCKWVNNCIGRRNYRPFFVLLSSMCSMLALQAAVGIWLTYRCFTDTEQIAARLAAAYPAYMRVREYEAALLVYSCVCAAALYPLGDLLLLHLVLACRGMTTWDYIMANRDTSIEPSALSRNVTKAFRYVRSLGPRSIRVRDDPNMSSSSGSGGSTAGGHKRHVGINPCLACTTELNRAALGSSGGSKFDHFFASKADRPEGFDAALIFTPRLGEEAEKQTGSVTPGAARHGGTQQVLIAIDAAGYQQRAGDEFSCGSETVFDPAVRTAAEIKAAQLALNKALPPPEVLDEVRALLQPSATSVVAELDKLNIYGPGGFFKPHCDTPRSQDHFGTLIICLPSPFKGGQLLLRHVDHNSSAAPSTRTYDWSASADAAPQGLQWAAFYADTEHEVLPVTEGHRMTLTYNLRAVQKQQWPAPFTEPGVKTSSNNLKGPGAEAGQPDQKVAVSSSSSNGSWMTPADVSASAELAAEVRRLLADKDWHGSCERLGFVLQQKYSVGLADLAALSFPEALKGPDRLLAAALQQAGLQPR